MCPRYRRLGPRVSRRAASRRCQPRLDCRPRTTDNFRLAEHLHHVLDRRNECALRDLDPGANPPRRVHHVQAPHGECIELCAGFLSPCPVAVLLATNITRTPALTILTSATNSCRLRHSSRSTLTSFSCPSLDASLRIVSSRSPRTKRTSIGASWLPSTFRSRAYRSR